jgi:hypothetical protein
MKKIIFEQKDIQLLLAHCIFFAPTLSGALKVLQDCNLHTTLASSIVKKKIQSPLAKVDKAHNPTSIYVRVTLSAFDF